MTFIVIYNRNMFIVLANDLLCDMAPLPREALLKGKAQYG
jgi:hypothetical protein